MFADSSHLQADTFKAKAYAIMPFVWSIGTILGPSIGGFFAEPAANFPSMFPESGIFGRYPYLLPNLICAGLMLVSILAGYFFLIETHPDMQPWSTPEDLQESNAETPLMPAQAGTTTAAVNLTQGESYGTLSRKRGLLACPVDDDTEDGPWQIFANLKGIDFSDDCLGFDALTSNMTKPDAWQYT